MNLPLSRIHALCLALLLPCAACAKDPLPAGQFAAADVAATSDAAGLGDGATADDGPADSAGGADTAAVDAAAEVAAGPTCHAALECLIAKKQWQPGQPPPDKAACTKGMSDDEAMQMDAVLGCVDGQCGKELDAWDKGGPPELAVLNQCLMVKCPTPLAVCVGGQGDKTCADAVKCLMGCTTLDKACVTPCLAPTAEKQAQKAGAFLECVLAVCTLDKLATCNPPMSCLLKCPELGG